MVTTAALADAQTPEVRGAIDRGWTLIESAFRRQIVRAQAAGQLDGDLDPTAISQSLLMSLLGLLALARAGITDPSLAVDGTFRLLAGPPAPIAGDAPPP